MTSRIAALGILLAAGIGAQLAIETGFQPPPVDTATMIAEADGRAYLVEPSEPLSSSMARGALAPQRRQPPRSETTACVPEPMEEKPEGAVACKCYELTKCKGNESRQCKRHCRKDLCHCCDV